MLFIGCIFCSPTADNTGVPTVLIGVQYFYAIQTHRNTCVGPQHGRLGLQMQPMNIDPIL